VRRFGGVAHGRRSRLGYIVEYAIFFFAAMAHLTLRARRYDLVHVNNMPDFLVLAAWLPRLLGRPVIHDVHDLMPELYDEKFARRKSGFIRRVLLLQERIAGNFASAVLTVEDRLKDILAERGIPRERITVLMNLPDDRFFAPRPRPPSHEGSPRFVLVYHGTLARRLGLDVAIRAIQRARREIPGIELRIIGAGEELDSLRELAAELGLSGAVSFSGGFVPIEQIPALIHDADVGIVPLRISSGTDIMLPTKLLEYVCVGIPCIVPRTVTISRYFTDEMVEFFEAESDESLAQAILALYRDPARRAQIAAAATAGFGSIYRWNRHKLIYTSLVARLLQA
jgi:glycosyltransferase involved in cell wall biosynthesis